MKCVGSNLKDPSPSIRGWHLSELPKVLMPGSKVLMNIKLLPFVCVKDAGSMLTFTRSQNTKVITFSDNAKPKYK